MSILPESSLLQKLKNIDPDAPSWVMDRFEMVGAERRKLERLLSKRSFKEGLLALFNIFASGRPKIYSADVTTNSVWETTGDNLRKAIKDYCDARPAIVQQAGITEQEWQSLNFIGDQKELYDRIPKISEHVPA